MNNVSAFSKQNRQGDVSLEKTLPCNLEAERSVLGAIILDNKSIFLALSLLSQEDFYLDSHRILFSAMEKLKSLNIPIDFVPLKDELQKANQLEKVGGAAYLVSLTDGVPRATNLEHYAKIIRDKARLRYGIKLGNELMNRCYLDEDGPDEIFEEHQDELRKANKVSGDGLHTGFDSICSTFSFIEERYNDKRSITGIASGLTTLDELTTGFQPGDLNILAAKTGYGKTAMALNIVEHSIVTQRKKVLVVSLEMTKEQLGTRLISIYSGVDSQAMRKGFINKQDWEKITDAAKVLSECQFWIYDKSITITELDARARRLADDSGLDLIVVDYLQLVQVNKRTENRTQEVSIISRALKAIASDLNVPLIALSQLNAEGEVRESRTIEQDASLVMVIEMDGDKLRTIPLVPATIDVRKNRNGPLGKIDVQFRKSITRFEIGV
jgi:replicative DNA helicase